MTFRIRNLSVMAYMHGQTAYHYCAEKDTLETCARPHYFSAAYDMMKPGDTILVSTWTSAAMCAVTAKSNGYVRVGPLTPWPELAANAEPVPEEALKP